jgi:hypothetical protein
MPLKPVRFVCGHCGTAGSSITGFEGSVFIVADSKPISSAHIYICSFCGRPTFVYAGDQIPGALYGQEVGFLPPDVEGIYNQARACMTVGAFSGTVLLCRKLLMHIAVSKGSPEGLKFVEYIDQLAGMGWVPPDGKSWINHVRQKGNEATHEIILSTKADAEQLITFSEMLLRFIFEFHKRIPASEKE